MYFQTSDAAISFSDYIRRNNVYEHVIILFVNFSITVRKHQIIGIIKRMTPPIYKGLTVFGFSSKSIMLKYYFQYFPQSLLDQGTSTICLYILIACN